MDLVNQNNDPSLSGLNIHIIKLEKKKGRKKVVFTTLKFRHNNLIYAEA